MLWLEIINHGKRGYNLKRISAIFFNAVQAEAPIIVAGLMIGIDRSPILISINPAIKYFGVQGAEPLGKDENRINFDFK
jgi:hypothetical protein